MCLLKKRLPYVIITRYWIRKFYTDANLPNTIYIQISIISFINFCFFLDFFSSKDTKVDHRWHFVAIVFCNLDELSDNVVFYDIDTLKNHYAPLILKLGYFFFLLSLFWVISLQLHQLFWSIFHSFTTNFLSTHNLDICFRHWKFPNYYSFVPLLKIKPLIFQFRIWLPRIEN